MDQKDFQRENPIFFLMKRSGHQPAELSSAFPGMSVEEITLMLIDNRYGLRRTVERFGYLAIRECKSDYFNIIKNGSRSNGSDTIPGDGCYQVHCYGGSTTLGANVADNQTISAFLELQLRKKLKVNVFNFGAGNHTSLHSSLRLLDHALSGNAPDSAIFLNGLNDCAYAGGGADGITPFLDQLLANSQHSSGVDKRLGEFVDLIPRGDVIDPKKFKNDVSDEQLASNVRFRYGISVAIQNFVAKNFGVRILRFIEPSPYLNCRPEQYLLPRISSGNIRFDYVKRLYNVIGNHGCSKVFGDSDFISIVDIGQYVFGPLYIDECHFSPEFNQLIAKKIAMHVRNSRRTQFRKRKKIQSQELRGTLEEVTNPHNYPLF
jgi:hypothetical protein